MKIDNSILREASVTIIKLPHYRYSCPDGYSLMRQIEYSYYDGSSGSSDPLIVKRGIKFDDPEQPDSGYEHEQTDLKCFHK